MTINHKPENTTKTNEAHPSLGKADNTPECTQMHCETHKTGNYAPKELHDAAEKISKAGYWSKVISGRIRTIIIWNGPSSSASETVWHKTADEALKHFGL